MDFHNGNRLYRLCLWFEGKFEARRRNLVSLRLGKYWTETVKVALAPEVETVLLVLEYQLEGLWEVPKAAHHREVAVCYRIKISI